MAFLSFRRYLVEIESTQKKCLYFSMLCFCACTAVSGSMPPNFKSKFAVVPEIPPQDGLSIFWRAQLVGMYVQDTSRIIQPAPAPVYILRTIYACMCVSPPNHIILQAILIDSLLHPYYDSYPMPGIKKTVYQVPGMYLSPGVWCVNWLQYTGGQLNVRIFKDAALFLRDVRVPADMPAHHIF